MVRNGVDPEKREGPRRFLLGVDLKVELELGEEEVEGRRRRGLAARRREKVEHGVVWAIRPRPQRRREEQAASRVPTRITFAWSPWPPGTPQIIPLALQCTLTSSFRAPLSSHGLPSIRA